MALFEPVLTVMDAVLVMGSFDQLRHVPKQVGRAPLGNSFQWSHLGSPCYVF